MATASEEVSLNSLRLARSYFTEKNYSRSFSHFLVHCHLKNQLCYSGNLGNEDAAQFSEVEEAFSELVNQLEKKECRKEIKEAFSQLISVYPASSDLHLRFGLFLRQKNEDLTEAKNHFRKAVTLDPDNILALHQYERSLVDMSERWHFLMLNDVNRNESYRSAIKKTIQLQKKRNVKKINILDVGTGSGLLALFAHEACSEIGQKSSIFGCEMLPAMIETAEKVFTLNKANVTLLPKKSTDCTGLDFSGQPMDLLITETFDAGLFGEKILETLDHAWTHFLHEGSVVIPWKAKVWISPIECDYVKNRSFIHRNSLGYLKIDDLEVRASWTKDEPYYCENLAKVPSSYRFMSDPQELMEINFQSREEIRDALESNRQFTIKFPVSQSGTPSCLALWFQLILDEESKIIIDTKPGSPHCWEQAIYPFTATCDSKVETGDIIEVNLELSGYFKLKSWSKKSRESRYFSGDEDADLFLPVDIVAQLNDESLLKKSQELAYNLSMSNQLRGKTLNILDQTFTCLTSMQLMSINPRSNLTVFMTKDDPVHSVKSRIDFISEIAVANHINLKRINCQGTKPEDNSCEEDDDPDLVFFDPIQTNGKLNSDIWTNFLPSLRLDSKAQAPTLFPWRTSVYFVLVESAELQKMSRLVDDSPCAGFQIAQSINQFSVTHLEEISFSSLNHRPLSEPTYIHSFDFRAFNASGSGSKETVSAFAKLTDSGTIHAVVYWFVHEFGWDITLSTCSTSHKQAAIIIEPTPVDPANNSTVSVLLHHQQGVLQFEVHS